MCRPRRREQAAGNLAMAIKGKLTVDDMINAIFPMLRLFLCDRPLDCNRAYYAKQAEGQDEGDILFRCEEKAR